jgi:hypothetical protein
MSTMMRPANMTNMPFLVSVAFLPVTTAGVPDMLWLKA